MESLAPVLELIRAHRSQSRIIGALSLVAGVAVLTWGLLARGSDGDAGVLGLFIIPYGIFKLVTNLGPAERDKAYLLLAKAPERVVWAYLKEVRSMKTQAVKERSVVVGAEDGKTVSINTPSPEDAARVLAIIAGVAPRATFGFAPDREKRFRESPVSLRAA